MKSAHEVFRGLRARARTGILIEGAACIAVTIAAFVVASYLLDRWLHLETVFRGLLLAGFAFALWRVATRRLRRPLAVELDDDELALAVERSDPGIRQWLISSIEFERSLAGAGGALRGQSAPMMESVVRQTTQRLAQIDFVRALDRRRVTRFGGALAAAAVGVVAFLALVPDTGLWARRNLLLASVPWPQLTHLVFEDVVAGQPLRIAEREDLTVRVRASGVVPDQIELSGRFASGERTTRAMDRTSEDMFAATLPTLLEDVTLVARGGDGETAALVVRIVPRPQLGELRVTLFPPDYVGTEPVELREVGGELRVPRGGELEIAATSDKPLRRAALVLGDDQRIPATVAADRMTLTVRFRPEQSGPARLEVTDDDDLGPAMPPQLLLRVVDDAPPELDFETQGVGSLITANARIPGTLKLRDDFGLASVKAVFRTVEAAPPESGEQPPEPEFGPANVEWAEALVIGSVEQQIGVVFDLLPLLTETDPDSPRNPIRPGLLLSLRFDATDRRAPEPQTGSSEVRTFRVVTTEKLLQELRRRQEEQRRELESVLRKVEEARAELADMAAPKSEDPNAARAELRVQTLARQQSALGRTCQGIGERYRVILDELLNNRLYTEPREIRDIDARVVSPLITLSLEGFPRSATLTTAFGETGAADARADAVESCDEIMATIRRVLEHMVRTESLARIIEEVRIVARIEREARELVEKLRDADAAAIFGDPDKRDPPADADKK